MALIAVGLNAQSVTDTLHLLSRGNSLSTVLVLSVIGVNESPACANISYNSKAQHSAGATVRRCTLLGGCFRKGHPVPCWDEPACGLVHSSDAGQCRCAESSLDIQSLRHRSVAAASRGRPAKLEVNTAGAAGCRMARQPSGRRCLMPLRLMLCKRTHTFDK